MTDPKKPRVTTLETPMMPDNVRVDPVPPSRVVVAMPEARHYVHDAPKRSKAPLVVMFAMAGVMVLALVVIVALFATGHLSLQ